MRLTDKELSELASAERFFITREERKSIGRELLAFREAAKPFAEAYLTLRLPPTSESWQRLANLLEKGVEG